MRAPSTAPQRVKNALAITNNEIASYTLPEGAFWGNIFATLPLDPPPTPTYSGPEDGVIMTQPVFHACAGPGSNIPDLTKRFCSSQGDDQVIDVVGICMPTVDPPRTGVCETVGPQGTHESCYLNGAHTGEEWTEVITVWLEEPIAACGNTVCEAGETSVSCPGDCHPGTWSRKFDDVVDGVSSGGGRFAISPVDNSIVMVATSNDELDLGGGPMPDPGSLAQVAVAKYDEDGNHLWSKRISVAGDGNAFAGAVDVLSNGDIVIAGHTVIFNHKIFVKKLDANGNVLTSPTPEGGGATLLQTGIDGEQLRIGLAHDSADNVFLYGFFVDGPAILDCVPVPCELDPGADNNAFLARLRPNLHTQWALGFALSDAARSPGQLAIDAAGDLFFRPESRGADLHKFDGATGATIWTRSIPAREGGMAVDPASNDLVIAGQYDGTYDFGLGPSPDGQAGAPDYYVARLANATGNATWTQFANVNQGVAGTIDARGTRVAFDSNGHIVVGGNFLQAGGATIDFGAGDFFSYASKDQFIASYTIDGAFRWAKHIPLVLDGFLTAMKVSSEDRVVVSGSFSGSMNIDGQFLPNSIPELINHQETYIASFTIPDLADVAAPVFMALSTPVVVAQATGPNGAKVWYMTPRANDPSGSHVFCTPKPNSVFGIGSHTVTCNANDPVGNASSTTFNVNVVDTIGPAILNMPANISVLASGALTPVTFTPPTAVDQVSGSAVVSCLPAGPYAVGTHTITCSATDAHANTSSAAFAITVIDNSPPVFDPLPNKTAFATSANGAVVTYGPIRATDAIDGIVNANCAPASGSVFALGTTTVTCTAQDSQGNTSTATFTVKVTVGWGGFILPLEEFLCCSTFIKPLPVPVWFTLAGPSAGIPNLPAHLHIAKITNGVVGPYQAATSSGPNSGNVFLKGIGSTYYYMLKTSSLARGKWRLKVDLHDGTTHTTDINLL
jgi:hypothetical protein